MERRSFFATLASLFFVRPTLAAIPTTKYSRPWKLLSTRYSKQLNERFELIECEEQVYLTQDNRKVRQTHVKLEGRRHHIQHIYS